MPRVGVALATALSALTCAQAAAPPTKKLDVSRADVQQFIGTMAQTHRFDPKELTATLSGATTQGRIIEAISRPAERTIPWWEYRDRFLTNARIDAGVALWAQQQATLDRIAADTGVPAEYLLAITGVETSFGRIMGSYRVLDALTTLAFDYPRRSEFFTQELEQYLLLARDENLSPDTPLGSYAGAMGAPQFMPSSVRRYAVDGDGDGRRDLWGNWADVFASVANYLKAYGWRRDEPVLVDAQISGAGDDPASTRLELNETVSGLRTRGYRFDTPLTDSTQAMLVPAQQRDALQWRVGFANFYAITRYNRSALYAMAVNDLAQALAQRRRAQSVGAASAPATATAPASE